jgi:hypothetical protein
MFRCPVRCPGGGAVAVLSDLVGILEEESKDLIVFLD